MSINNEPMNEREAEYFEGWQLGFGEHKGKKIRDVPLEYLKKLDEHPDFRRELK